jgi:hypothetical protein
MVSRTLVLEFSGRCMIRQPTDPDPYDERRGGSGYTFAFGDEPDLNRVIYFQQHDDFPVRSHCPPVGVTVDRATVQQVGGALSVDALCGARVDLLDSPVLENRNWALTPPGYEPIVPFHLEIATARRDLVIARLDVLDPTKPDTPIWQLPKSAIVAKGANGLAYEPQTVGRATGFYDGYLIVKARRALLQADLDRLRPCSCGDDPAIAILEGRISELDIGIAAAESGAPDRRTAVHSVIERFGYSMSGHAGTVTGDATPLDGALDLRPETNWRIDFWIGGWDFDSLCGHVEGALQIPYLAPTQPEEPRA